MAEGNVLLVDCTLAEEGHFHCCGILALGTALRAEGYDPVVLEANQLDTGMAWMAASGCFPQMVDIILERSPRMVLFHTLCGNYLDVLRVAGEIRRRKPDVAIAFGGPHATATARETMDAFPFVDLVACGECDDTVADIVRFLDGKVAADAIPNILYRDSRGSVATSPASREVPDLSALAWPDYELVGGPGHGIVLNPGNGLAADFTATGGGAVTMNLDVGRGCPYGCRFCSTGGFFQHRYRLRSADSIVTEVRRLYDTYGTRHFSFLHDLFTFDKGLVLGVCSKLAEAALDGMSWSCSAREDTLDDELLDAMAAAGCQGIFLGIETGSPRMQKLIGKNLDVENIPAILTAIRSRGMEADVSLIYGFPEETEDDLRQTTDFAMSCISAGILMTKIHQLTYFPATRYLDSVRDRLVLDPAFLAGYHDLLGRVPDEWELRTVTDHPDIFPSYYWVPDTLVDSSGELSDFQMNYHYVLYGFLPDTHSALIGHYGGMLELSRALMGHLPEARRRANKGRLLMADDYPAYFMEITDGIGEFIGLVPDLPPDVMDTFTREREAQEESFRNMGMTA